MNTVMDDNKTLTLVSNERIPLTNSMRMVFEMDSLKNASPATVSRAGILYINEADIGWAPVMEKWVRSRESKAEKQYLPGLFEKYVMPTFNLGRGMNSIPVRILSRVNTVIGLVSDMLDMVVEEGQVDSRIYREHLCIFRDLGLWRNVCR